jgi:hypothetical protein
MPLFLSTEARTIVGTIAAANVECSETFQAGRLGS